MRKVLLCFGNEFLKEDSLAKEIVGELGIEAVLCNSVDDVLGYPKTTRIYILDVVKNISKVTVIKRVDQLKIGKIASLHDFDLSYFLKLLEATGSLPEITIIGIPMKGNKERIKKQLLRVMASQSHSSSRK